MREITYHKEGDYYTHSNCFIITNYACYSFV